LKPLVLRKQDVVKERGFSRVLGPKKEGAFSPGLFFPLFLCQEANPSFFSNPLIQNIKNNRQIGLFPSATS
jgi:hypothetical protein